MYAIIKVHEEEDPGVNISKAKQCLLAYHKANRTSTVINRNIEHKPQAQFLLYNALVKSYLEHGDQFWSPNLIKDEEKLERIQEEQQN